MILDSEDELDRSSVVCSPRLVVACVDSSLEEEDEMSLDNRKKGLRELLKARGSVPKDASGPQSPLPLPPFPPPLVNPFGPNNLKKRKKEKEAAEEGELVLQKERVPLKQQKMAKGTGRVSLVESKEDRSAAEVYLQNPVWEPWLELDGVVIPWNSTIWVFQKGNAHYLAEALE